MKMLVVVLVTLIIQVPLNVNARVIASDYSEDSVGVYYFNAEDRGIVTDHGANEMSGVLIENARLVKGKYGKCLSLGAKPDSFAAADTGAFLGSLNEFSVVAWVKIPEQPDDFEMIAGGFDVGLDKTDINRIAGLIPKSDGKFKVEIHTIRQGIASLTIKSDGNLSGEYIEFDNDRLISLETTGKNVNNNQWHHIGFVINDSYMRLYLNGHRIANKDISGYRSFLGDGSFIHIGEGARGLVDNAGFFEDDFSDADIKLIYDIGLEKIMSIAPVEPGDKITTTWGEIKSHR